MLFLCGYYDLFESDKYLTINLFEQRKNVQTLKYQSPLSIEDHLTIKIRKIEISVTKPFYLFLL